MMTGSVLFVVTRLALGGAETQILRVSRELAQRGWRVGVISLGEPTAYVEELERARVEVFDLRMGAGATPTTALRDMRRLVRKWRPDVLCAFLFHASLAAAMVSGLRRRPAVISSFRDPTLGGRSRVALTALMYRVGRIDRAVSNSERVSRSFVARGVIREAHMLTIPNGIVLGPPADHAGVREELGLSERDFFWLTVGNFMPQKDYPSLIEAFGQVSAAHPEARLVIVGRGAPEGELARSVEALGDRVLLLGRRRDVPRLMAACDAFVLASSSEGFPNVVMEALEASRGVVATAVGGVPELIVPDGTGLLVPPRRPAELARAMLRLGAMAEEDRAALGARGRDLLGERYELGRVVDQWERLFLELRARR